LPDESPANLAHVIKKVTIDRFDITDADACRHFLIKARPEVLFHLAAISSVGQSFAAGELTFRVNVIGSYNVYEAVRGRKWLKKVVFASSSDVYGPVKPNELPLKPDHPFNPVSPYAQTKAAGEYLGRMYVEQYDLPLVTARSFNHTGPRQSPYFVIPSFCRKIVAAEQSGGRIPILVGNLDARRDISDVRDVVRGYRLLAEKGSVGEVYHFCSGRAYRIGDLLNKLIGLTDISVKVRRDRKLIRAAEVPVLLGSFAKTRRDIGWRPMIGVDTTLQDVFDFWYGHN
jgi:GDP-4-dehydro-6-deoxy-D-mannose reductase